VPSLLIGLGSAGGQALAQYYPPAQAYPSQGYPPRRPLPSVADGDDDAPPINAPVVRGSPLPPIGVGPQWNGPPARTRYGRGTPASPADTAPPAAGDQPYRSVLRPYGVPGAIPPGPAGSAKQDAILQEAMRSPLSISPGPAGPGPDEPGVSAQGDPRNMAGSPPDVGPETRSMQPPQNYEHAVSGTPPYYGVPGAIPPGPAGSAEQDAILREAMQSRLSIRPGQIGPGPDDPSATGSIGGGDPRNMAAFPPDVRPETGPKKELPPQFRRTFVDYPTKEPAGAIIIDTPNTYLYLVLGNGKALRYGVGVGREGFNLVGRATGHEDGGVARLESAGGDDRAPALSAALHGPTRSVRARSISARRCTASTAPISPRPLAPSCPLAASG
jgi:hypothetical protein